MAGRAFLIWFVGAAAALAAGIYVALVALDPFDRGHGLFSKPGTLEGGPRTATVSRGRDLRFNAAIIGNSHVQLLKPARLNGLTGWNWVQLTVPATTPREQFVVLEWFRRNHLARAEAVIIGADYMWCSPDPEFRSAHPFPHWLYDPNAAEYYSNLFRMQAARILPRRVAYLVGRAKARPADGYWDYEAYRVRNEELLRKNITEMQSATFWNETGRFPWIDRLGQELSRLPAGLRVAVVTPPLHPDVMPSQGSSQWNAERACVAAMQRIAGLRPLTLVVDVRKDSARYADPSFFWDATHYSKAVAETIETDVSGAFSSMRLPKGR